MNKIQLIDALAERVGDRRIAAAAVDGLLDTIVETVRSGESVALTGFGVFEPRARAARTARNPRTGAAVAVPATTVPAFRPGAGFRAAVGAAAQANGATSADVSVPPPAPVAAEPPVEAPATRGKNGGKAAKGSKGSKVAKAAKTGDDKGKGAKAKKAKSKK